MCSGAVQGVEAHVRRRGAIPPWSEDVWVAVDARPLHAVLAVGRLLQVQRQAVVLHLQGVHLLLEPLQHLAQLRGLGLLAAAGRGRGEGGGAARSLVSLAPRHATAATAGPWPAATAAQARQGKAWQGKAWQGSRQSGRRGTHPSSCMRLFWMATARFSSWFSRSASCSCARSRSESGPAPCGPAAEGRGRGAAQVGNRHQVLLPAEAT